ncbi:hypothetical protein L211DRAFT_140217 [Terfezia boudieri ATCC MYA-4762]|uniref:Uncharacterized protein n=1 Tax=Terfezia boudieri ATCC MYA-4762 TaxID=1051890 RepID=A0A3N4LQP5_9PEZI|nr:hypothetical protein L211DRAFT_140217 [Terfezia boudieri ATCC MYA-4762]
MSALPPLIASSKLDPEEVKSSKDDTPAVADANSLPDPNYVLFGDLRSGSSGFTGIGHSSRIHVGVDKDFLILHDLGMVCAILQGWLTIGCEELMPYRLRKPAGEGTLIITTAKTLQSHAEAFSATQSALLKATTIIAATRSASNEALDNPPTGRPSLAGYEVPGTQQRQLNPHNRIMRLS